MALFSRMRLSIWYNIIPFDPNDVYDMSTSMGQRWDHVLTLIFNADYLLFKKSQLSINIIKWQNLCLLQEGADMIQIVSFRPRDNKNSKLINNDLSIDFTTDREVNNINAQEVIRVIPPSKFEITQK